MCRRRRFGTIEKDTKRSVTGRLHVLFLKSLQTDKLIFMISIAVNPMFNCQQCNPVRAQVQEFSSQNTVVDSDKR